MNGCREGGNNGPGLGCLCRGWTVENAQALGLDGWVRNCSDGTVEACFCGPAPMIQEMLSRCC